VNRRGSGSGGGGGGGGGEWREGWSERGGGEARDAGGGTRDGEGRIANRSGVVPMGVRGGGCSVYPT